jgi:3-oxoacyl-[acyl-carrier-protein] synthase II
MHDVDERRVVVTGLGMVTPLAGDVGHNWSRLTAGESGIRKITNFDTTELTAKIAGQPPLGDEPYAFRADDYLEAKDRRKMDDFIIYAVAAAQQAVEDAGWQQDNEEDRCRTGVMI